MFQYGESRLAKEGATQHGWSHTSSELCLAREVPVPLQRWLLSRCSLPLQPAMPQMAADDSAAQCTAACCLQMPQIGPHYQLHQRRQESVSLTHLPIASQAFSPSVPHARPRQEAHNVQWRQHDLSQDCIHSLLATALRSASLDGLLYVEMQQPVSMDGCSPIGQNAKGTSQIARTSTRLVSMQGHRLSDICSTVYGVRRDVWPTCSSHLCCLECFCYCSCCGCIDRQCSLSCCCQCAHHLVSLLCPALRVL